MEALSTSELLRVVWRELEQYGLADLHLEINLLSENEVQLTAHYPPHEIQLVMRVC